MDKRNITDILGVTYPHDGGIQQWGIAKATSMSEKTTRVRDLQVTTQGALDKRILRSVNIVKQNLAPNSRKE